MAKTTKRNSTKSKPAASKKKSGSLTSSMKSAWKDDRTWKILGLFILLAGIFLLVAFTSYLFTWKADSDIVMSKGFWAIVKDTELTVQNHLGRLGAALSNKFFYSWFGLSSFLFPVFIIAAGINLFTQKKAFKLWRLFFVCAFFTLWFSTGLTFAFGTSRFPYGGAFGKGINDMLIGMISSIGTGILLVFLFWAFLLLVYNFSPELRLPSLQRFKSNLPKWPSGSEKPEKSKAEESKTVDQPPTYYDQQDLQIENKPHLEEDLMPLEVKSNGTRNQTESAEASSEEEESLELDIKETPEEKAPQKGSLETNFDPTLDLPNYKYPSLNLLEDYSAHNIKMDKEELERNKDQIIETLNNYNIKISKIMATIGPTVTLYEIIPAPGVRISKIKNLEDDIALSLSALGIRIIAPIPGKGTIGIEVPNVNKQIVSMKSVLASSKFQDAKMDLPVGLGKTISSENYVADLARMPHLLMAGATGQGKSVGINAIIISLLYKKHPSQLKFVLIDPKKVELSLFQTIERHFLAILPGEEDAIITDTRKVVNTLNSLCIEMDLRYNLLKSAQVRNIKEYNKKFVKRQLNPNNGHRFLPFIVLVIDEFADLIMTAGKEIEMPIARLAQLARAIGIHLVIATQRPSVNIITGMIKANFPARVAFKVTSKIDSRTILDTGGADQLIGRGDMLLSINGDVIRLQCPFVDTPEVESVAEFIGAQQGYEETYQLPEYVDESDSSATGLDDGDRDALFEDAARVVIQNQQGSTSLIQRRLKLGYNRAGRLMDQLEAAGIVGPNAGSKAREVLFHSEMELEQYLQSMK